MTTLAFDVGGTHVRCAVIHGGEILHRIQTRTKGEELGQILATQAQAVLLDHDVYTDVAGVGIGIPEYVNSGVVSTPEVIDWRDDTLDELTAILVEHLGYVPPIVIDSDVRCAAVAEHACLRHNTASSVYVSWGTGISCTLVLPGGRPWVGKRGRAIALGEWIIDGQRLESYASGRGIERSFRSDSTVSSEEIHKLAEHGDPVARAVIHRAGTQLGIALTHLALILDPDFIVLGGG